MLAGQGRAGAAPRAAHKGRNEGTEPGRSPGRAGTALAGRKGSDPPRAGQGAGWAQGRVRRGWAAPGPVEQNHTELWAART